MVVICTRFILLSKTCRVCRGQPLLLSLGDKFPAASQFLPVCPCTLSCYMCSGAQSQVSPCTGPQEECWGSGTPPSHSDAIPAGFFSARCYWGLLSWDIPLIPNHHIVGVWPASSTSLPFLSVIVLLQVVLSDGSVISMWSWEVSTVSSTLPSWQNTFTFTFSHKPLL